MAKKAEILSELAFISDRISTQVRTVSLSIIALAWLFLGGAGATPPLAQNADKNLLLVSGALCLLALLSDYFQYVAGYFDSKRVLDEGDETGTDEFKFNYHSTAYRLRGIFFFTKQVLVISGFGCFGWAVLRASFS